MAGSVLYKELFEVKFLHHFLLNDGKNHFEGLNKTKRDKIDNDYNINDLFEIIPTPQTNNLLRGHQLILKKTNKGFLVISRVGDKVNGTAFTDLRSQGKLTFHIGVKNSCLMNFSALSLKAATNTIYYFNNLNKESFLYPALSNLAPVFDATAASDAASDGNPDTFAYYPGDLLTDNAISPSAVYEAVKSTNNNITTAADWQKDMPAGEYDNSATYSIGDIVSFTDSGAESLYQAINETTGNNPADTSNWKKMKDLPLHYITISDLITVFPRLYNYTFSASGIDATFEVKDINNNTVISETFTSTDLQPACQVDMRNLPEGKYSIQIVNNSDSGVLFQKNFYLMGENDMGYGIFGVIDIFLGTGNGNYSIVDASNTITSNVFELRFKNRSTIWRYLNNNNEVVHESDFNPLTKNGFLSVLLDGKEQPNPGIQIIKPEPQQYYSEIYINTKT